MKSRFILNSVITGIFLLFGVVSSMAQASGTKYPEPTSWSFPDIIESARKISPNNVEGIPFNQFGLVYPNGKLTLNTIKKMPAETLQNYADIVTHAYPDAISKQLPQTCINIPLSQLNETSIAGFAYISLHAIDANSRQRAKVCLKEIQDKID